MHNADGSSLRRTTSASVDAVFAHAVFVYLPLIVTFGYWEEIVRVAKPDGFPPKSADARVDAQGSSAVGQSIQSKSNWVEAKTGFNDIVKLMVQADLQSAEKETNYKK